MSMCGFIRRSTIFKINEYCVLRLRASLQAMFLNQNTSMIALAMIFGNKSFVYHNSDGLSVFSTLFGAETLKIVIINILMLVSASKILDHSLLLEY